MHEIICPHCSKAFKIDEAGYADIQKQVRDKEFERQLHERLELAEQDKRNALELAQARMASELKGAAAAQAAEIQDLKARLDAELIGNVSIRGLNTERPDTWEVQGRGELQLAILVEMMRREGFELTVGKPQVVTREIDGKVHEPVERLTIDIPEDFVGVVTQLMGLRRGRLERKIGRASGGGRV